MNGRFFLDTNIFVYSFDASSPKKAAQARKLIRSAIETRSGIVSYHVVQEFFNVAPRRFSKPMSGVELGFSLRKHALTRQPLAVTVSGF
jgi:predicted nucleic acid-binding protein